MRFIIARLFRRVLTQLRQLIAPHNIFNDWRGCYEFQYNTLCLRTINLALSDFLRLDLFINVIFNHR